MILLADCGSTKTDWSLVDRGKLIQQISTKGTNPFYQSEQEISEEIKSALLPHLPSPAMEHLFFYGAGCMGDKIEIVKRALSACLHFTGKMEVNTDMLAAARSLCGHRPGIACIMGTGSNSCSYDGENMLKNVSPLGFILGDEGSGAVLGKLLVGNVLKNQLPVSLIDAFFEQYPLTRMEILNRVYTKPYPNRFLASFAPFLQQHIDCPEIREMVVDSFKSFLKRNVMQYEGYDKYSIHFIGSIAYFHRKELELAGKDLNIEIGKVERSPMKGLIAYHAND